MKKFLKKAKFDKPFFFLVTALVFVGFLVFVSASLGLHAREGATFSKIVFNQVFFGLILGTIALMGVARTPYKFWAKYSFFIFLIAAVLTAAVFIPGLGFSSGGATRWLSLGPLSFQPAEFLKIAFVIYLSALLTTMRKKVRDFKTGPLLTGGLLVLVALLLLLQPDSDSFLVIAIAAFAILMTAGAKWWHIGASVLAGVVALGSMALFRPYIRERIITLLQPASDPLGAGYHIKQSLIAVGSGEWWGRGIGQSIQKFNYLPEPIGDSIFAVFAEEWGFIGAAFLIALFLAFIIRGFKIASNSSNMFAQLIVTGLVTIIGAQSFINIGAMIGVFPLTGIPLVFVSHGGTALLFALVSCGIILNVSESQGKGRR